MPAINAAYRAVPGLGIRCLNKVRDISEPYLSHLPHRAPSYSTPPRPLTIPRQHLMGVVLGYLHPRGGVAAVCRYWRRLAAEIRVNGPPSGAVEAHHARPEHPRYVKRQASRDVSDEMLQVRVVYEGARRGSEEGKT